YNAVLLRHLTHQPGCRPLRDALRQIVPLGLLFSTEIRSIEEFLQANNLRPSIGSPGNESDVLLSHCLPDLRDRRRDRFAECGLNQSTANDARHEELLISAAGCGQFPDDTGDSALSKRLLYSWHDQVYNADHLLEGALS